MSMLSVTSVYFEFRPTGYILFMIYEINKNHKHKNKITKDKTTMSITSESVKFLNRVC